jgi:hypothetical protein
MYTESQHHSLLGIRHCNQGRRKGGREGSNIPPHLSKIFSTLEFFFSKVLVAPPQKLIKGQKIFKRIKFHESHHVMPFFNWFFNLKPVTTAQRWKKIRLKTNRHIFFASIKTHRFVFNKTQRSFNPSLKRKKIND